MPEVLFQTHSHGDHFCPETVAKLCGGRDCTIWCSPECMKELNAERIRLIQERQTEYAEYRKVKADRTEFIRAKQNADVILNRQETSREGKERS